MRTALLLWRDADRTDRLQLAAAALVAAAVMTLFVVGAASRDDAPQAHGLHAAAPPASTAKAKRSARHRRATPAKPAPVRIAAKPLVPGAAHPPGTLPRPSSRRPAATKKRPQAGGSTPPPALGASDTPVTIGVTYRSKAITDALGQGSGAGDPAAQARAVADWVNANGGIGGHPLQLRPAPVDTTTSLGYVSAFAAACAVLLGGDQRPIATVGALDDASVQTGCLAPQGVPFVGASPAPGDRAVFANAGRSLFAPGSMAVDRLVAAQIRLLLADGFLASASRVGIVRVKGAAFERTATATLRPALVAANVRVVGDEVLPGARTVAEVPALLAAAQLAALRLRVARADRIVVLDDGVVSTPFMQAADRVGLRPRYALNSTMAPAGLPGRVPAAQLAGAAGAGFSPLLDVAPDDEPPQPERRALCTQIYTQAKVGIGPRTADGQFAAIGLCDAILALRDAAAQARSVEIDALLGALEHFGSDHPSAVALRSRLTADGRDGAAAVRRIRFEDACRCMRYTGPEEVLR